MILNKKKLVSPEDIGRRLNSLRKKNNISIGSAANYAGISTNTMYHYERGTRQPSADVFYRLCCLYGLEDFSYFYNSDPEPLSDSENELLQLWRALPADKQKALIILLKNQ